MGTTTEIILDPVQLQNMLAYKNENVISRFTGMFAISEDEAEDIFRETIKFLYIVRLPKIYIMDDLVILDEMWHNFILFTKEYHRFCTEHFGKYLHHLPASKKEKEEANARAVADPEGTMAAYKDTMRRVMSVTYDHLGSETVVKWFQQYPEQYSRTKILELRKR